MSRISLDELLQPLPGSCATGPDLRSHADFITLSAERDRELKRPAEGRSQWGEIARKCQGMLTERSKDLRVALWLTQALSFQYGFEGLREGIRLMRKLEEQYGDTLHPQAGDEEDEDDVAPRQVLFAALNHERLLVGPLRTTPLMTAAGNQMLSWRSWDGGRRLQELDASQQRPLLNEGWMTSAQFMELCRQASAPGLFQSLDWVCSCQEELRALTTLLMERYSDADEPVNLEGIQKLLQECRVILEGAAELQRLAIPERTPWGEIPSHQGSDPTPETVAPSTEAVGVPGEAALEPAASLPSTDPSDLTSQPSEQASSRATAAGQTPAQPSRDAIASALMLALENAGEGCVAPPMHTLQPAALASELGVTTGEHLAGWLIDQLLKSSAVRDEPGSPSAGGVRRLWLRSIRFDEVRAAAPSARALLWEAPTSRQRLQLRLLLEGGKWQALLDLSDQLAGSTVGRGWLDVHAYAVLALEGLGGASMAEAQLLRHQLQRYLQDVPELLTGQLMDGTPTFGKAFERLHLEIGCGASCAGTCANGRQPGGQKETEKNEQALLGKRGPGALNNKDKLMRLSELNEGLSEARSERALFLSRLSLIEFCIVNELKAFVKPQFELLMKQVEKHELLQWEEQEVIERLLLVVIRYVESGQTDEERQLHRTYMEKLVVRNVQFGFQLSEELKGN